MLQCLRVECSLPKKSLNGVIVMSAVAADSPVAANAAAATKTKKVAVYQKIVI